MIHGAFWWSRLRPEAALACRSPASLLQSSVKRTLWGTVLQCMSLKHLLHDSIKTLWRSDDLYLSKKPALAMHTDSRGAVWPLRGKTSGSEREQSGAVMREIVHWAVIGCTSTAQRMHRTLWHCLYSMLKGLTLGSKCSKGRTAGYDEDAEPWQPDLQCTKTLYTTSLNHDASKLCTYIWDGLAEISVSLSMVMLLAYCCFQSSPLPQGLES